jgi:hypothetical protein
MIKLKKHHLLKTWDVYYEKLAPGGLSNIFFYTNNLFISGKPYKRSFPPRKLTTLGVILMKN